MAIYFLSQNILHHNIHNSGFLDYYAYETAKTKLMFIRHDTRG